MIRFRVGYAGLSDFAGSGIIFHLRFLGSGPRNLLGSFEFGFHPWIPNEYPLEIKTHVYSILIIIIFVYLATKFILN